MITVTLLGTGALSPIPERALAAAALTVSGRTLLFDCGEGTQTALRREHISPLKIDVIALTHYHGDHIFGLPGLLQTMMQEQRQTPLWIIGPGDVRPGDIRPGDAAKALAPILTLAGALPYRVFFAAVPKEGLRLDTLLPGWETGSLLSAFPGNHSVPEQCYRYTLPRAGVFLPDKALARGIPRPLWGRLQKGETVTLPDGGTVLPGEVMGEARRGLSVCYSGDTAPCPGLIEAARGADLFVCEGTYGDSADTALAHSRGHSTFADAAEAAAAAGAKRLWLSHFSQSMTEPEQYLSNAAAVFPDAVCGTDGMRILLRFENDAPET